jgi:hypothetical protein
MTLESLKGRLSKVISYGLIFLVVLTVAFIVVLARGLGERYLFFLTILYALGFIFLIFLISQQNTLATYINSRKSERASLECLKTERGNIYQLLLYPDDKIEKSIQGATLKFNDVFVDIKSVHCDVKELRDSLLEKRALIDKQIQDREKEKEIRRPLLVYILKRKLTEVEAV